ncbi:hypothetical protein D3C87_1331290 [compost metagenome]
MKKTLFAAALILPLTSFAALDIKPGLWTTKMTIEIAGQKLDPAAMMDSAFAMMSAEQKKKVEDMIAKSGHSMPKMDKDGAKTCMTAAMLKDPNKVTETKECKTTITSQTSKKIVGTFKCTEPEASGTFEWNAKSQTEYTGVMNGKTADGKSAIIRADGKFVSADCGKVKPAQ